MSQRAVLSIGLILGSTCAVSGSECEMTVGTSSPYGTPGSLDFNFNLRPLNTQAADLQACDSTGETFGNCATNAQRYCVTGALPVPLTFDNKTAVNDYFDDFTFSTTVSFDVDIHGPALNHTQWNFPWGSTFAISTFPDAAGTAAALTNDATFGIAAEIEVNLDDEGSIAVTSNSARTTVSATPHEMPPQRVRTFFA